jgi:rubrerythrin
MSALEKELREAIATAVKMETDGMAFYRKASESVKSPMGKLMFQSFIKDEERHLEVLNEILQEMFHRTVKEAFVGTPASRIKSIFQENRPMLEERISAEPGDIEALEIAMDMEDKGYKLYKESAEKTGDDKLKALFERLASEEQQHYSMMSNALTYLTDTGNWLIYDEHGIMDG